MNMNKRQKKKFNKKHRCKTYQRSKLRDLLRSGKSVTLSEFKEAFGGFYKQIFIKRYHDSLNNGPSTENMKKFTLKELEKLKCPNSDESTATFQSQMFRPYKFDFAKSDEIEIPDTRYFSEQMKLYSESAALRKQLIIMDVIKNRGDNDESTTKEEIQEEM